MTGPCADLVGLTFGRLTVVSRAENTASGKARWNCACACGRSSIARTDHLRSGRVAGCGCVAREMVIQRNAENRPRLAGKRFGRLLVREYAGADSSGDGAWHCLCDCGSTSVATGWNLQSGNTRSCGCLRADLMTAARKGVYKTTCNYRSAHRRIQYARGYARDLACVDCDQQASQWSYDHRDPDELVDARRGYPYSLDPSHYQPRCRSCHASFDKAVRKIRAIYGNDADDVLVMVLGEVA